MDFILENYSNTKYNSMFFSTSYESTIRNRRALKEIIEDNNIEGKILVDLLLSNGNSFNRYIEIFVKDQKIKEIKVLKEVNNEISEISLNFYKRHLNLLNTSVLTPYIKKCIEVGRVF